MPRVRPVLPLVALALLALGCSSSARAPDFTPPAGEKGNVLVYLSNQSSARRSVTLAVYVDGRLAGRETLGQDIHDHREVSLCLSGGCHRIRVVAEGHVAQATTEVVAGGGTIYISAAYEWIPGSRRERPLPERIDIAVQDRPFGFC